jgi:SAM-dependent methyltransferase
LPVLEQDAHDPFGSECFDAVFSNAALHWMRDPDRVLTNVYRALRPGGRFVVEQGGFGNVAAVVTAITSALEAMGLPERAVSPWDFPSATLARARLKEAGFEVTDLALIPRPTPLVTGIAGWLRTFAGPFTIGIEPFVVNTLLKDVERRLFSLHDPAEGWIADYVRLRFRATKRM